MKEERSTPIAAVAVALLVLGAAVPGLSQMRDMSAKDDMQRHGHMMEMGNMDKMGDMMDLCLQNANKIGLSDDQLAKIKPVHSEMKKKNVRFKADLKIAEIELMEIMEVKDFDLERASSVVKKIGEIRTAEHLEMLQGMAKVRAVMTDEQFKNMQAMMPMKADGKKPARRMKK